MGGRADLRLWLKADALRLQAAMVDAGVNVEFGKALVDVFRPSFPPPLHHLRAVPGPHLLAETALIHAAHGEHDMGVGLGRPFLGHVPMHIEVGDHAPIHELGLHEVAGEFDALRLRHLARKGELDLTAKLGVLPDLEGFDIVPEPFAVAPLLGRILRQQDLGVDDAALVGEVVAALKPVVAQPRGRAVGGGRHRAGAGFAANDLDVKMIDRHRDPNIITAKRTSERRISAPSKLISRDGPRRFSQSRQPYSIGVDAQLSSLHRQLMETVMRKPRDFDSELKSLEDKARDLKARKVQQLGELVISTGADALTAEELAGALIVLAETKDAGKREAWAKRGAAFFRGRPRRSAPSPGRDAGGAATQSGGAQPASGGAGAV